MFAQVDLNEEEMLILMLLFEVIIKEYLGLYFNCSVIV